MEPIYFLPSEIARLVLGYLKQENCMASYKSLLKESSHLGEYSTLLKQGLEYPTTVSGLTLKEMLQDYAHIKLKDTRAVKCSQPASALWKQFDDLVSVIKQQVSPKQLQPIPSRRGRTRLVDKVVQVAKTSVQTTCINTSQTETSRAIPVWPTHEVQEQSSVPCLGGHPCSTTSTSTHVSYLNSSRTSQRVTDTSAQPQHNTCILSPRIAPQYSVHTSQVVDCKNVAKQSIADQDEVAQSDGRETVDVVQSDSPECDRYDQGVGDSEAVRDTVTEMFTDQMVQPLPQPSASTSCQNSAENVLPSTSEKCVTKTDVCLWDAVGSVSESRIPAVPQVEVDKIRIESVKNPDNEPRTPLSVSHPVVSECDNAIDSFEHAKALQSPISRDNNSNAFCEHEQNYEKPQSVFSCIGQLSNECVTTPVKLTPTVDTVQVTSPLKQTPILQVGTPVKQSPVLQVGTPVKHSPVLQVGTPVKQTPVNDYAQVTTPVKPIVMGEHLHLTPCKSTCSSFMDTESNKGKSPRRKRFAPKRRSLGTVPVSGAGKSGAARLACPPVPRGPDGEAETSKISQCEDSFLSHVSHNEDSMDLPTLLEQMLNNTTLQQRLAENINKGLHQSTTQQKLQACAPAPAPSPSKPPLTPLNSSVMSLEDILDMHETKMSGEAMNNIIDLTRTDPAFDGLFQLFDNGVDQDESDKAPGDSTLSFSSQIRLALEAEDAREQTETEIATAALMELSRPSGSWLTNTAVDTDPPSQRPDDLVGVGTGQEGRQTIAASSLRSEDGNPGSGCENNMWTQHTEDNTQDLGERKQNHDHRSIQEMYDTVKISPLLSPGRNTELSGSMTPHDQNQTVDESPHDAVSASAGPCQDQTRQVSSCDVLEMSPVHKTALQRRTTRVSPREQQTLSPVKSSCQRKTSASKSETSASSKKSPSRSTKRVEKELCEIAKTHRKVLTGAPSVAGEGRLSGKTCDTLQPTRTNSEEQSVQQPDASKNSKNGSKVLKTSVLKKSQIDKQNECDRDTRDTQVCGNPSQNTGNSPGPEIVSVHGDYNIQQTGAVGNENSGPSHQGQISRLPLKSSTPRRVRGKKAVIRPLCNPSGAPVSIHSNSDTKARSDTDILASACKELADTHASGSHSENNIVAKSCSDVDKMEQSSSIPALKINETSVQTPDKMTNESSPVISPGLSALLQITSSLPERESASEERLVNTTVMTSDGELTGDFIISPIAGLGNMTLSPDCQYVQFPAGFNGEEQEQRVLMSSLIEAAQRIVSSSTHESPKTKLRQRSSEKQQVSSQKERTPNKPPQSGSKHDGSHTTPTSVQTTTASVHTTCTSASVHTSAGVHTTSASVATLAGVHTTSESVYATSAGVHTTSAGVRTTSASVHTTSAGVRSVHATSAGVHTTSASVHTTSAGVRTTSASVSLSSQRPSGSFRVPASSPGPGVGGEFRIQPSPKGDTVGTNNQPQTCTSSEDNLTSPIRQFLKETMETKLDDMKAMETPPLSKSGHGVSRTPPGVSSTPPKVRQVDTSSPYFKSPSDSLKQETPTISDLTPVSVANPVGRQRFLNCGDSCKKILKIPMKRQTRTIPMNETIIIGTCAKRGIPTQQRPLNDTLVIGPCTKRAGKPPRPVQVKLPKPYQTNPLTLSNSQNGGTCTSSQDVVLTPKSVQTQPAAVSDSHVQPPKLSPGAQPFHIINIPESPVTSVQLPYILTSNGKLISTGPPVTPLCYNGFVFPDQLTQTPVAAKQKACERSKQKGPVLKSVTDSASKRKLRHMLENKKANVADSVVSEHRPSPAGDGNADVHVPPSNPAQGVNMKTPRRKRTVSGAEQAKAPAAKKSKVSMDLSTVQIEDLLKIVHKT